MEYLGFQLGTWIFFFSYKPHSFLLPLSVMSVPALSFCSLVCCSKCRSVIYSFKSLWSLGGLLYLETSVFLCPRFLPEILRRILIQKWCCQEVLGLPGHHSKNRTCEVWSLLGKRWDGRSHLIRRNQNTRKVVFKALQWQIVVSTSAYCAWGTQCLTDHVLENLMKLCVRDVDRGGFITLQTGC